jgi:hypothetical protein
MQSDFVSVEEAGYVAQEKALQHVVFVPHSGSTGPHSDMARLWVDVLVNIN